MSRLPAQKRMLNINPINKTNMLMRKFYTQIISAIAAVTLSAFTPATAVTQVFSHGSAAGTGFPAPQQSPSVDLSKCVLVGYSNPQEDIWPYTGFTNNSDTDLEIEFVLRIEAAKLASYKDAKVVGMRLGMSMGDQAIESDIEAFVRSELNGKNLVTGKGVVKYGWNIILFDEPLVIDGSDLFIGGRIPWVSKKTWLATACWATTQPAESQYMGVTSERDGDGNIIWTECSAEGKLLLSAIVQASGEEFSDKAEITNICTGEMKVIGSPSEAWMVLENTGVNSIERIKYSVTCGNTSEVDSIDFGENAIPQASTGQFKFEMPVLGNGRHTVKLVSVNGQACSDEKGMTVRIVGITPEVASRYTRRPLIERWVSESEYRTVPYTDDVFVPGLEGFRDRMSIVAHHVNDQFMQYHEFDKDVDNEDLQLLVDFVDGDKSKVFLPVMAADRSFETGNPIVRPGDAGVAFFFIYPYAVGALYESVLSVPTFASVNVNPSVDGNRFTVDIEGEIEPDVLPAGEPLHLTAYLVEDGIESTSQEFPDDESMEKYNGRFVHNDVIRLQLTDMYGDILQLDNGSYKVTFTGDLEPDWNTGKMRVVAFVNRSPLNGRFSREVLNSTETPLMKSGIASVGADAPRVSVIDGRVTVAGAYDTLEVYDVNGRHVAASGLSCGVYVVRLTGTFGVAISKVVVR